VSDRYHIEKILGQGGVGITYAAFDQQTGERVALKVLSLRAMQDWKQIELFEREAQILQQLNHPAIPRYIDSFEVDTPSDHAFYIVQQLAEGESLAELVQQGWRSSETEVRAIAAQVLEILIYLHRFDPPVIHRDIKPQNLIRSPDGRVRLVDFGAVQNTYYNTFMRGSTVVGPFGYMAPEQFRGQAVPATDLYGLAATLLFLLTWRSPSELPQHRLKLSFRSRVQVSDFFADWLEKMLEPDAEDRFASAQEALQTLKGRRAIGSVPTITWKAVVGTSFAVVILITVLDQQRWLVLRTLGFRSPEFCRAIARGYSNTLETVEDYLNRGGDPGDPWECYRGLFDRSNLKMVEFLLKHGADVNAKNSMGETPLHWAAANANPDTAKLLLEHGADVNAKDNMGWTPFHRAAANANPDNAKLLLEHGADVNAKANSGETPLYQTAFYANPDMAKLLLEHGADVNAKTNSGETLFHRAAANANPDMAKLLLEHGADVNATTNSGATPLHRATGYGRQELVRLLREYAARE